ncbi:MAG TPA: gfo/Idh/MocA family oxidoreductase, partial [Microbacterium sp.]|nr:gfo/Idh/MocA family oxidoreductase [Microbacterium sp.]
RSADGSAEWDGESAPVVHRPDAGDPVVAAVDPSLRELAGSLATFVTALRTGHAPENAARDNLRSLAMVEAAVQSAETWQRVLIDDVLERARQEALAVTDRDEVRERLGALG